MPVREDQLIEQLMPDFFHKQNPGAAWMHACSVIQAFPGLRGFWPMSGFDSSGDATDLGGLAHHLTYNGNPTYNYADLVPYIDLDGTGDYLSHVDHADFDILGTETYVDAAARGLTVGGWFWFNDVVANYGLLAKFGAGGGATRAYYLFENSVGTTVQMALSTNGAAVTHTITGPTIAAGSWQFIASRFIPSGVGNVWVNETKGADVVGMPAAIFNSNSDFCIGARSDPTEHLPGRASLCWVCAENLSDAIISALYRFTGPMYGHKV